MRKIMIVTAAIAALALSACGGSQETQNTVVTENVVDESGLNDSEALDGALGNAALGNELTIDNAAAATESGNALTAVDNSQ